MLKLDGDLYCELGPPIIMYIINSVKFAVEVPPDGVDRDPDEFESKEGSF